MVIIHMQSGGKISVEMDAHAPNTVKNFLSLARSGYYDGLTFHRIIPGFMIQGGCPHGSGMGGPGYAIKGEFRSNGFDNPITHSRGVISMARSGDPDSAGSQFFIMHSDAPHLDGAYAAFGKVIDGLEEVDRIAGVPTGMQDRPKEPVVIERIEVIDEEDLGEPEKV